MIKFKKIHENAKLPKQGKHGDAAFDLYCVEDFNLPMGVTKAVSTGLVLADMPAHDHDHSSLFLQIEGRSGLASKGVWPVGGIIDATYRGEIKVLLHNGNQPHLTITDKGCELDGPHMLFKAGDRIAQLVIRKIVTNDDHHRVEFEESDTVTETDRGADGFGSTGKQ